MRDLGFTSWRSLYALQDETQTEWREIDRRRGYDSTSRHILDAIVWYHRYQDRTEEQVEEEEERIPQGASKVSSPEERQGVFHHRFMKSITTPRTTPYG